MRGEAVLGRLPAMAVTVGVCLVIVSGAVLVPGRRVDSPSTMLMALAVGFLPLGLFLVRARPHNRVSRLVWAVGVLAALALAAHLWSNWAVAAWMSQWLWWPAVALVPLVLLLFPDGGLPSPKWRPLAWTLVGSAVLAMVCLATAAAHHPRTLLTDIDASVGGAPLMLLRAAALLAAAFLVAALGVVAAMVWRWLRADALDRRRLACLVPAAVLLLVGIVLDAAGAAYAMVPGVLALPVGIAAAIMVYRLDDLDLIVNRSLVWLAMTLVILTTFALSTLIIGELLLGGAPLLATALGTGLVAALFDPVRRRIQRATDRMLFGDRDEPYAILTALGRQMQSAADAGDMLVRTATAITEALRLPYARVVVVVRGEPVSVAEHGRPLEDRVRFPMELHGQPRGFLEVSPRRSGEALTSAESALLVEVAGHAAIAAAATELTLALQRSRERLVLAREEERLRLRRELHDGLGPTLAGTRMTVSAARGLMASGPAAALLQTALEDLARCSSEIRTLLDGLRPAALDDGLEIALRQTAGRLLADLEWSVSVEGDTRTLSPAVEVAAFRVATEAMANVVKHAAAAHCRVTLERSANHLVVIVTDDGTGGTEPREGGVGLESMATRTEELGGDLNIRSTTSGTCVTATFPVRTVVPGEHPE